MSSRIAAIVTAGAVCISAAVAPTAASAATVVLNVVEIEEVKQTYERVNGNFLSLWQISNTDAVGLGIEPITVATEDDLLAGFTAFTAAFPFLASLQGSVVNLYNGPDPVNDSALEFSEVTFGFIVPQDTVRSFWIEWTGPNLINLVSSSPFVIESSDAIATLDGDPLAPIPVPGALPLLVGALGALGLMARRRKAA